MVPIHQYEHEDIWLEGVHIMLFSHDDLQKVIAGNPFRKIYSGSSASWLVDYPKREDEIDSCWYDNRYQ